MFPTFTIRLLRFPINQPTLIIYYSLFSNSPKRSRSRDNQDSNFSASCLTKISRFKASCNSSEINNFSPVSSR
ncbi:hypothetical protein [Okeania sp.]|uniref:hypothetical protein n=1 Tax=Okeania sp. TaxID=3100323 RepID=UPI002B4B59DC|nr:hypothetical protein [Okeania sp.]MEB3339620.1 hypothetical protein [Okeania sp.]